MSLDGRTAMANGESKWITSPKAREDVQAERATASAILSTSGTVLADDPSLTVRWAQLPEKVRSIYPENSLRQPVRVILDRFGKISYSAQLFNTPSPVWLIHEQEKSWQNTPHFVSHFCAENLYDSLKLLGEKQVNTLWVEAGATFAGALIEANLVDELILYVAPKLLGDKARGLCHLPHLHRLSQAPQWALQSCEQIGQELKLIYHREETA